MDVLRDQRDRLSTVLQAQPLHRNAIGVAPDQDVAPTAEAQHALGTIAAQLNAIRANAQRTNRVLTGWDPHLATCGCRVDGSLDRGCVIGPAITRRAVVAHICHAVDERQEPSQPGEFDPMGSVRRASAWVPGS